MEYGIQFAETGHLCLATLHANSANQALDRIINFFPEERRQQLLMDLVSEYEGVYFATPGATRRRYRPSGSDGNHAQHAVDSADLIFKGEVGQIKEIMAKSTRLGMQTFDQSLFALYEEGAISYEEAMRNADSKNELRLRSSLKASAIHRLQRTNSRKAWSSWKKIRPRLSEP